MDMSMENIRKYLDRLKGKYGVRCCDCIILHNHKPVFRHLMSMTSV